MLVNNGNSLAYPLGCVCWYLCMEVVYCGKMPLQIELNFVVTATREDRLQFLDGKHKVVCQT